MRPSLGRRRGEERASRLGHNATTPSPHCAARVLRGRSADTVRGGKRAGHAPRYSNAVITIFQKPCRQPAAVLLRSSLGRRREEARATRWAKHNHAKSALRGACAPWPVNRYSTGRKSAWATRHRNEDPKLVPPTVPHFYGVRGARAKASIAARNPPPEGGPG